MVRFRGLKGAVKYLITLLLVVLIAVGFSSLAWAEKESKIKEPLEKKSGETQEEYEERVKGLFNFDDPNCLQIYITEPELDLGNVSPLKPIDKEGEESFQIWVLSGNDWIKRIEWSDLVGVEGDDAEGKVISKDSLKAFIKLPTENKDPLGHPAIKVTDDAKGKYTWVEIPNGWMVEIPGSTDIEKEHFKMRFNPAWCNHAGSYSSTLTVEVSQL